MLRSCLAIARRCRIHCVWRNPVDGKSALSEISLQELRAGGAQSLLEVRIETGRKHQIRRHLAGLGFPLVGDRLIRGRRAG